MRHTPRPAGAPAGALALLLAATLALAGCSGDDATTAAPETVETTHADGTVEEVEVPEVPQTWPLTGIEVPDNGSADARHPVLVTKMDNTPSSSPQLGLSHADLVVEELVEGGITRLAAFYYSDIPGAVGPVRSMRASDIGIVTPIDASIVTSGAANITLNRIAGADITHYTEGSKGFFREPSRYAPYNLMANLHDVASTIKQKMARPEDYLPWGSADDLPKGVEGDHRQRRLRQPHDELEVPERPLRQHQQLRGAERPVPDRHRAGAAGAGRRRGLPRPGRLPGARDQVRRRGRGAAVPRRPAGAGDVVEEGPDQPARRCRPRTGS